jgi:hypothetical protein
VFFLFPEFLHSKVVEFTDKEREMEQWIDETLEKAASGLPTRKDYEARLKVNNDTARIVRIKAEIYQALTSFFLVLEQLDEKSQK